MKKLLPILVLLLAVGCASPYQPVYVSNDGGYYIAETGPARGYYAGTGTWWGMGPNPWWLTAYDYGYWPHSFYYYSPYFYPHYFSVWYPVWHSHYYGWGGGWHPPYRRGHHGRSLNPPHHGDVAGPAPFQPPYARSAPIYPRPGKTIDEKAYWQRPSERAIAERNVVTPARPAHSVGAPARSTSVNRYSTPRSAASARPGSSSRSHHAPRSSMSSRGVTATARRPSSDDEH